MPQLKKLSTLPSNILPKMDLNLNQSFNCGSDTLYPQSYLTLLIEEEKSLTSDQESDVSDSVQSRPRKRQRLDHLSQEEKIMRRKLKNRVAAQTARDRKKARMQELEEQVSRLAAEKKVLLLKTVESMKRIQALEHENSELKLRLGTDTTNSQKVKVECISTENELSSVSEDSRSLEQAEGTGSADTFTLDDAVHLLASNSETDDLLDLLQQCGEDLMEFDFNESNTDSDESRIQALYSAEVVGTAPKSMESNKELIHFDHIYSKQEDSVLDDRSLCLSLPDCELSTKDSHIPPQTPLPSDLDDVTTIPIISIPSEPCEEQIPFECDTFSFHTEISEHLLSPPTSELKPCSSPASSSDAGYDSSFSVPSPCGDAANPWDDTLTELFPSLV